MITWLFLLDNSHCQARLQLYEVFLFRFNISGDFYNVGNDYLGGMIPIKNANELYVSVYALKTIQRITRSGDIEENFVVNLGYPFGIALVYFPHIILK